MKTKLHFVLSLSMILSVFSVVAQQHYWQQTNKADINSSNGKTDLNQKFYQTYQLNLEAFKAQLSAAPLRSTNTRNSNVSIYLPNGKGQLEQFMVVEAPVLSEELSRLYPNIKTYVGYSPEQPGTRARFSVTPQGLQSLISYPDAPMHFTVPLSKRDNTAYISYSRDARTNGTKEFECFTEDEFLPIRTNEMARRDANDQILRTFRIAISAHAEYTNFWDDGNAANGNAQEDALAQVVSTLNRSNEVFEVDMAVNFMLVTGTEIIYTDPNTDPYTGNFNSELQATLTANVGEANYDIGHLFAFGGGGNAGCIGCVCVDGQKGSGYSAHPFTDNDGGPYMSDFFDIDYVPHEIGHQMGANHTYSHFSEGTGVNAEPGSGTTIMGYAGITGANDVQDHSDPYFHYYSITQILDNLNTRTCWTSTAISNSPPTANAGTDYTIPIGTAFVLKGAATDPDAGDVLTYTWEQIDDGVTTSGNFGPNKTAGAVWRSRPPSTSPDRYMPIIERVIAGELTETSPLETIDNSSWETVSNVGRNLNFALIVRDRSEANGVGQTPQSDFDTMMVTVDDASGPFLVSSQTTNEIWDAGSNQIITWDVAGTNAGAVNTPTVNILLSTDSGFTFPFVLAADVPNDGSHNVTVPITGGDSSTVRVKVEGNNNIFYAINSTNFSIQESEFVLNVSDNSVDICSPDNAEFIFTYNTFLGFSGTTTFSATGLPIGASASFSPTTAVADGTVVTATVSGIGTLAIGNYPFSIVGTSGGITKTSDVEFNVFDTNIGALNLLAPVNGAIDIEADNAVFTWDSDLNATTYEIDIATDAAFTDIIADSVVNDPTFTLTTLNAETEYYWRVRGVNDCGSGNYSQASFTTANIICFNFDTSDTPVAIPDNDIAGVNSIINVTTASLITDVNVTVNVSHNWTEDVTLKLIAPDGTEILLSAGNGGSGDDYSNTIFDSDASTSITAGTAPFTGTFQPEGDLSLLNGNLSSGDWTLNVSDTIGFISGTLDSWSLEICGIPQDDDDMDGIPNDSDNCPTTANSDQSDIDGDGVGDVCDDDMDNDTILNDIDNCPMTPNTDQTDLNNNGIGDVCEESCTMLTATDTPIAITEGTEINTYTSIIAVGFDQEIADVNVNINIPHTWVSDLDITLTSPTGTIVELTSDNGGSAENYIDTIFDSEATTSITAGTAPFTGTFSPEGDLSVLNGEFTAGDWILTVVDDFPDDDGGSINEFTLELCVLGILSTPELDVDNTFSIFPNPNNGEFTVILNNSISEKVQIELYDINGRRIYDKTYSSIANFRTSIRLENVQSGIYLIKVKDGTRLMTRKLVID
ncbi:reprolysin-like metallopeptidase [Winogradskyella flava]|uniref:reprolysin-like metallopeptidase n=1 Tax=Winogradskyella flava TaxID=1884876 RepID=UPI0024922222|nr:proprotein convertase P-domain-containing protein [Winogradskyella flava]